MATSYDLDIDRVLRSIRQRKATGGFVPQSFINDVLGANIQNAASRAASDRQLTMQEERDKTQREQFASSQAFSSAEAEKNRAFNEAQAEKAQEAAGKQSITSAITQLPTTVMTGKYLYNALKPAPEAPIVNPDSLPVYNANNPVPSNTLPTYNAENPVPAWLKTETPPAASTPGEMYATGNIEQAAYLGEGGEAAPVMAETGSFGEMGAGGADVAAEGGGASLSGIAAPLAYIAAAEMARGQWGGQGLPYEEKTKQQRTVDSPATAGMMATVLPGSLAAPDGTVLGNANKNMSALERTAMAPIDYAFGDKDAFNGETLRTAGNALYTPFEANDNSSDWSKAANMMANPVSIITGGKGTWLCTEIHKFVGMSKDEIKDMKKLRRYTVKNHKEMMVDYWSKGDALVVAINDVETPKEFYTKLKADMVDPIIAMIKDDKLEEAYDKYKRDTIALVIQYKPDLLAVS